MPVQERTLYQSENGDRWSLGHDPDAGTLFVRHQGNAASGGHCSDIGLGEFLGQSDLGFEKQELLRLIAGLVDGQGDNIPVSRVTNEAALTKVAGSRPSHEESFANDVCFALREIEMLFGSLARQFARAGIEHAPDDLKLAARELATAQERITSRLRTAKGHS